MKKENHLGVSSRVYTIKEHLLEWQLKSQYNVIIIIINVSDKKSNASENQLQLCYLQILIELAYCIVGELLSVPGYHWLLTYPAGLDCCCSAIGSIFSHG